MRGSWWTLALPLSCLAIAGCQKASPTTEPKTDTSKLPLPDPAKLAEQPSPAAESPPPAGSTVTLLSPGSEPRRRLRFHVAPGAKQTGTMRMKMAMDMRFGGNAQSVDMPTIVNVIESTAKRVTAGGDIDYEFAITDVDIGNDGGNRAIADGMKGMLTSMKGLGGTITITSRGFTKSVNISIPPGVNPQVAQMMGQMKDMLGQLSAPLPEEPVGVGGRGGARWPRRKTPLPATRPVSRRAGRWRESGYGRKPPWRRKPIPSRW